MITELDYTSWSWEMTCLIIIIKYITNVAVERQLYIWPELFFCVYLNNMKITWEYPQDV
jgi:hypothetical protein